MKETLYAQINAWDVEAAHINMKNKYIRNIMNYKVFGSTDFFLVRHCTSAPSRMHFARKFRGSLAVARPPFGLINMRI